MKICFIGTGWIGQNYACNLEERGYEIVRYSLDPKYIGNKDKIKDCDITFLALPTPSTPEGFDYSIVEEALGLIGKGKIAVIKSTILPEVTNILQDKYPDIYLFHSPEFLTEATAKFDVDHPKRNIVGMPINNDIYKKKAQEIMDILPKAPYNLTCSAREASFIKYGSNCWFYFKVLYINMLYDLTKSIDENINWEAIKDAMSAEPMVGTSHLDPIHKGGRGAANHCLLKDMAAFRDLYKDKLSDEDGMQILDGLVNKNIKYLIKSNKDIDLLKGVYGEDIINK